MPYKIIFLCHQWPTKAQLEKVEGQQYLVLNHRMRHRWTKPAHYEVSRHEAHSYVALMKIG